jgi:hypothetical protein
MPAIYDDHAEAAFWDAESVRSLDEFLSWTDAEEELVMRPEVVSLERWLDLNA